MYRTTFYKGHLYRILWRSGARFSRRHLCYIRTRPPHQALCYFVKNVSTNYAHLEALSVLLISRSVGVTAVWLGCVFAVVSKDRGVRVLDPEDYGTTLEWLYLIHCTVFRGRDCAVGIATRYGLNGQGIESQWGVSFSAPSRPVLGRTQPSIQWVPGLSRG